MAGIVQKTTFIPRVILGLLVGVAVLIVVAFVRHHTHAGLLPAWHLLLLVSVAIVVIVAIVYVVVYAQRANALAAALGDQESQLRLLKQYEYLMRHASDAIFVGGDDGIIWDANEKAVAMYGYSREELIGMEAWRLRAPEELGSFQRHWRHAEERAGMVYRTRHRRKDGTTFPVEISMRVIEVGGTRMRQAIVRDLSERETMDARLRLAERLASMATMAGGMAHEINNPLACIKANLDFALDVLESVPGEEARDIQVALAEARQAADRIRDVVAALGTMSGSGVDLGHRADPRAAVEEAVRAQRAAIQQRARLTVDLSDVPQVAGSEPLLTQALVSILENAVEAIAPLHPQDNEVAVSLRQDHEGRVVITIRDTGCGMTPEVMARIFDPFYTTREVGQGQGLGLALAHGVVTRMGGEIQAESAPGKGSTFRVVLPAAEQRGVGTKIPEPAWEARLAALLPEAGPKVPGPKAALGHGTQAASGHGTQEGSPGSGQANVEAYTQQAETDTAGTAAATEDQPKQGLRVVAGEAAKRLAGSPEGKGGKKTAW